MVATEGQRNPLSTVRHAMPGDDTKQGEMDKPGDLTRNLGWGAAEGCTPTHIEVAPLF